MIGRSAKEQRHKRAQIQGCGLLDSCQTIYIAPNENNCLIRYAALLVSE